MSGGKSKSTASTTTSNSTEQLSVDGVAGGDIQLAVGEVINFTDQFSPEVRAVFGELIDFAGKSLDLVGDAGSFALGAVSERVEQQEQPELSVVRDLLPVLMVVAVGGVAYMIFRRK